MNAAEWTNDGASSSAAAAIEIMQVDDEIGPISTPDCVDIDCVRSSIGNDKLGSSCHYRIRGRRVVMNDTRNEFKLRTNCEHKLRFNNSAYGDGAGALGRGARPRPGVAVINPRVKNYVERDHLPRFRLLIIRSTSDRRNLKV
ncbi:hypothetical protein EVAR_63845_1 [Eumeta japonica]|uniref:Uncharacterized protein n=1 Tax=Eumeta variegata TaxID=151549 RepID=A0A4C1Z278_EUMVA|nr:hypothetical protein EVAR_63845_1 [Eumeta japonica]